MDRALGGPFGSERFSKDERFLLMMGGQSTKDLKDHLKTTHSQLEVFRPCFFMLFIHQVTPGSAVNLKVSSQPGSLCAISAIDRVGNIKGVTHKVLSCFICDTP